MSDHRGRSLELRCARAHGANPRPFPLPGDPERHRRGRPFDLAHLDLAVTLLPAERALAADARLDFVRRDATATVLPLDAVGFTLDAVTVVDADGAESPLAHDYDGATLALHLGDRERGTVRVRYRARPRRGMYFMAPDEHAPQRPAQVWTQCQDEDARHWFPCHDAPDMRMTTALAVTAPAAWTVLSNGVREGREDLGDGRARTRWRHDAPHPSYLVTLVAGTFAELDATAAAGGLPVRYWVDPGREEDGWRTLSRTPAMIAHFAERAGVAYPWAKYDQVTVHDFTFGGMENTSLTTLTERCLLDARAALDATSDDLVAHELAHQWFGDLVTCRDWSHAWLNEGFATFFEHVDVALKDGPEAALYSLEKHADAYFAEDGEQYRRPIVCATWSAPIDLFDRHLYEKGGWVLHMLRAELGEATFWKGVQAYVTAHRGGSVETHDLQRALEEASGRSLGRFFAQWLHAPGHPELELELRHDPALRTLHVTLRQTQTAESGAPMFALRVPFEVTDAAGVVHALVLDLDDRARTFTLRDVAAPKRVALDPGLTVLAKVTSKLSAGLLRAALKDDARAPVRWRAARSLARVVDDEDTVTALRTAVSDDAFWGVSVEAARSLGELRGAAAYAALAANVGHSHPKVRRAVVRALGEFRTAACAELLLGRVAAGDASWLVESELLRSLGRTRQPSAWDALVAGLDRESWRDAVRVGAVEGIAAVRDARAAEVLRARLVPTASAAVRRALAEALAEVGEGKREVREALEELLDGGDPYVVPDALRAVAKLHDAASVPAVSRVLDRTDDGRIRRAAREALRALTAKEGDAELRRLRDELDVLRDELRSLRDRVASAEPKPRRKARAPRGS